ncbi:GIY-YIG nuclease family protein [Desulforhopalus singaporensis]|uniref:Putative endonuclease n=1 Tax=Desulforhopalus singaporensis TaxID=91360 RepID=A0A1H0MV95_9BACT|nr:GIY-YIG nuclease family protein [Desulforhopalus singaporensis]SDO84327.1 putative endonuclease [Desulforhopalus singaporensis]
MDSLSADRTRVSRVWYIYILRCRDNSLYTGITTDPARRLAEHNSGTRGARYTRSRRPANLVYIEQTSSRSNASRREAAIKKMTAPAKQKLIESFSTSCHEMIHRLIETV